ncbi:hypothetical protein VNO77_23818 [Canavalia gladiata]|uniref:Uncharacterized protein n=1 Tax=Canavalia gladiata TaxID=3824 RepID=A0AAN9QBV9_CANGL
MGDPNSNQKRCKIADVECVDAEYMDIVNTRGLFKEVEDEEKNEVKERGEEEEGNDGSPTYPMDNVQMAILLALLVLILIGTRAPCVSPTDYNRCKTTENVLDSITIISRKNANYGCKETLLVCLVRGMEEVAKRH